MTALTTQFGFFAFPLTGLVTLFALLVYFTLALNVGRARAKYRVQAPSTDGPPEFQRIYRAHINTLEHMALFLPLLWLAALSLSDFFAAAVGVLWPLSRVLYAHGYYREPKGRFLGFGLGVLVNVILFGGAAAGLIAAL